MKSKEFLRLLQSIRELPPDKKDQLREYLIEIQDSGDTSARPASSLKEDVR